jgi:cellulose biosynthesis protein BcsQ
MDEALDSLGLPIARTEIPLTAAFQNAAVERLPLLSWQRDSLGAAAYWRLAQELR